MRSESPPRDALASTFDSYAVRNRLHDGDRHFVYEATVDSRRAVCETTDDPNDRLRARLRQSGERWLDSTALPSWFDGTER